MLDFTIKAFLRAYSTEGERRLRTLEQGAQTPYERYLSKTIEEEKKTLDKLYTQFAHANLVTKPMLKMQIDIVLQNIELLSHDLEKYRTALSYLREKSKERDELAERLGKIEEKIAQPASPSPAAVAKGPAPTSKNRPQPGLVTAVGGRPTVGKPLTTAQPSTPSQHAPPNAAVTSQTIGQQGGAPQRPRIGQPIGTPTAKPDVGQPPAKSPTLGSPVGKPSVGTPVARPRIGTPIGKPVQQQQSAVQQRKEEKKESQGAEEQQVK